MNFDKRALTEDGHREIHQRLSEFFNASGVSPADGLETLVLFVGRHLALNSKTKEEIDAGLFWLTNVMGRSAATEAHFAKFRKQHSRSKGMH
jgi:hypothetical protein